MKTNIYECYTSLKVEDLENLKKALLNFYQINHENNKQQINDFLLNFNNRFGEKAVVSSLSWLSCIYNYTPLIALLASTFSVLTIDELIEVLIKLITMAKMKKEIKSLNKKKLDKNIPYKFNDAYFYQVLDEFEKVKLKQKVKSL